VRRLFAQAVRASSLAGCHWESCGPNRRSVTRTCASSRPSRVNRVTLVAGRPLSTPINGHSQSPPGCLKRANLRHLDFADCREMGAPIVRGDRAGPPLRSIVLQSLLIGPIDRLCTHSRMYHNQFGRGIDKDHLATDAQQHKPTVGAGQQPDLVAIPVVLCGYTRREMGAALMPCCATTPVSGACWRMTGHGTDARSSHGNG
jgi:hypothetical protein